MKIDVLKLMSKFPYKNIAYFFWFAVAQNVFALDADFVEKKIEKELVCVKDQCASLQDRMKHYHVPGVSIAIIDQGKIVWGKGYGVQDLKTKQAVTTQTIFQACSISKPVSALAILQLIQNNELNLDKNINDILTSWHISKNKFSEKQPVTIRKLLNHTAGFATGRTPMMPLQNELPSTVQILNGEAPALSKKAELEFVPGSKWQYSGIGYTILQLILEEHYGQPFPLIMREHVLAPLQMNSSSFTYPVTVAMIPFIAHGYTEQGLPMADPWFNIADLAAGGLWTTSTDLAKFVIEIQQAHQSKGKILDSQMVHEMLQPYRNHFGLGLRVGGEGRSKWFGHAGDNAGYKAVMIGFLESGQGAVVLTNSDAGWDLCLEILKHIGEIYHWPIPAPESF